MGVSKKNFVQNVFNILSIVAIIMATVSLISVNNFEKTIIKNEAVDLQKNKISRFIEEIPDVEIVNADGSVVKLNSTEDNYNESKRSENTNSNKSDDENNTGNNNDYDEEKFLDKKKAIANNGSNLGKIIPVSRNKDVKKDKIDVGNFEKKDKNDVGNFEKKDKNNLLEEKDNENNSELNDSANRERSDSMQKAILQAKNLGNFVVQVATFKNVVQAENQCKKIKFAIEDKHCDVIAVANNFYCSVVYPFNSKDDAYEFSKKLSEKIKVKCFVRTNA